VNPVIAQEINPILRRMSTRSGFESGPVSVKASTVVSQLQRWMSVTHTDHRRSGCLCKHQVSAVSGTQCHVVGCRGQGRW